MKYALLLLSLSGCGLTGAKAPDNSCDVRCEKCEGIEVKCDSTGSAGAGVKTATP